MRRFLLLCLMGLCVVAGAQPGACVFKPPFLTIHFGTGDVRDINTIDLPDYSRVNSSCPSDGHYAFTGFMENCFNGDWFDMTEDHTPSDADGNMMLVNASYSTGLFFNTDVSRLKSSTTYEFGVWMMNVCRISDKCPFPLLPNITIKLKTLSGRTVAQFNTGDLPRREAPHWTQYRAVFTTPPGETAVTITMQDNAPGGCGNDFALDDITFRECVRPQPVTKTTTPKLAPEKTQPAPLKPVVVAKAPPQVAKQKIPVGRITETRNDTPARAEIKVKPRLILPPPPAVLLSRSNPVVKEIQTESGDIKIDVYDNGEIDGDTVTIYHNNTLLVSRTKLSQTPISFHLPLDAAHPHHELVMAAENLGSIPPNTSLMIVTVNNKRYQVFISSTEQKNAKVVFNLKE